MELFIDVSQDTTYGPAQPPWSLFRPDYVVGVTGSNGALTEEFYWRYTNNGRVKKEGADLPELEVALSGHWLEGAMPRRFMEIPDTDLSWEEIEYVNYLVAVRVSKGTFRDYVPDATRGPHGDAICAPISSRNPGGG